MTLRERILYLLQEHHEYGHNGLLHAMPLDTCEKIDFAATTHQFADQTVTQILKLLKNFKGGYTEELKTAYDQFVECSIYLELGEKGVNIERVPEEPESRPDFCVTHKEMKVYFEAKALGWARGSENYNAAIESGIDAQISIQEQIMAGELVAFGESEITPLGATYESFSCPPKHFIESVVNKLNQNIKSSQFSLGPTFLICDLSAFSHPTNAIESGVLVYKEPLYGSICSGELWHIAFGKIDTPMLRQIEFEGKPNVCGYLEKEGILNEHDFIKGILFRTRTLQNVVSYTALIDEASFEDFGEIVVEMCEFYNDEKNSYAFKLSEDES